MSFVKIASSSASASASVVTDIEFKRSLEFKIKECEAKLKVMKILLTKYDDGEDDDLSSLPARDYSYSSAAAAAGGGGNFMRGAPMLIKQEAAGFYPAPYKQAAAAASNPAPYKQAAAAAASNPAPYKQAAAAAASNPAAAAGLTFANGLGKGLSKDEKAAMKAATTKSMIESSPHAREWMQRMYNYLEETNEPKNLANMGQHNLGLSRPSECNGIRLIDALMSDKRFKVQGDKVSLIKFEDGDEDGEDGEDGEGGEGGEGGGEDGEDGKDEAEASAAPSAAASEAARAEDADQYDGNVSGHVYSISADGKVAYINFPANENVELFNCMCEWLKTHKSLGNKKEHISAFTMIKGKKFGQNLIAYRSNSDPAIFDVLEKGSEINFFVDEQKDKFNVKSYHAVQLSFV